MEVSRAEALERARDSRYRMSAAHAMLYAASPHSFMGKYDCKYSILVFSPSHERPLTSQRSSLSPVLFPTRFQMQMRFDGTLGFPGGVIDEGESPEKCVTREFLEETGCGEVGRSPVVFAEQV